jgi:hypothetical protein
MPNDERPFIRLHNGMPEHPKIVGLSDAAFRALIELWCYCDRATTDGNVPDKIAGKYKRPAITELEREGLIESGGHDWKMHDYLDHQRSAADIATSIVTHSTDAMVNSYRGGFGAHVRWHIKRGITDQACRHCQRDTPKPSDA